MSTSRVDALGAEVYLRRLRLVDLDERVIAWFQQTELVRYYSRNPSRFTKDALIHDLVDGWEEGTLFTYGIYAIDSSIPFGILRIGPVDKTNRTSDMSILVGDRSLAKKGYAVEAIRLGNRLAFERHDIRKLSGGMYEANIAAIKTYLRAGWVPEGKLVGHYLVDGEPMDRVLVACFNPRYFPAMRYE